MEVQLVDRMPTLDQSRYPALPILPPFLDAIVTVETARTFMEDIALSVLLQHALNQGGWSEMTITQFWELLLTDPLNRQHYSQMLDALGKLSEAGLLICYHPQENYEKNYNRAREQYLFPLPKLARLVLQGSITFK